MRAAPEALLSLWDWSEWFELLKSDSIGTRWHAVQVIGLLQKATDKELREMLAKYGIVVII